MKPPHIVIDTNVLISALLSRQGASNKLLSLIGTGKFEIHVSVPLVLEYEDVLLRQRVRLGISTQDVDTLLDGICAMGHRQKIYFLWRPYLRDKKDEFVLELAVAAQCDYIVSFNKKNFHGADKFGINILNPREFLQKIGELP